MATISKVCGIKISINARGEHPPPHFHFVYNNKRYRFKIKELEFYEGSGYHNNPKDIPKKIRNKLVEWTKIHQNELLENWTRLVESKDEPFYIDELN